MQEQRATGCQRSDLELQAAYDHLYYEIWMFRELGVMLMSGGLPPGPISNAALEAFTLHARVLLDVLFSDQSQKDDVLAVHLVPEWPSMRPSQEIGALRGRVGKEIAHLTYARQRVTAETKSWDVADLYRRLLHVIRLFVERVPDRLLGARWAKDEHQLRRSLQIPLYG